MAKANDKNEAIIIIINKLLHNKMFKLHFLNIKILITMIKMSLQLAKVLIPHI